MNSRYVWFLAVTMLFPMSVVAADRPALTTQQQEVMKVSEGWRDAFNHRDLEKFAHYVAEDFIASTDEGDLLTKTAFIQYLSTDPQRMSRKQMHTIFRYISMEIRPS